MRNLHNFQNKYACKFLYILQHISLCMFHYMLPCNSENMILYNYWHILQYNLHYNHLVDWLYFGQLVYTTPI